jgi:hypothetical protein
MSTSMASLGRTKARSFTSRTAGRSSGVSLRISINVHTFRRPKSTGVPCLRRSWDLAPFFSSSASNLAALARFYCAYLPKGPTFSGRGRVMNLSADQAGSSRPGPCSVWLGGDTRLTTKPTAALRSADERNHSARARSAGRTHGRILAPPANRSEPLPRLRGWKNQPARSRSTSRRSSAGRAAHRRPIGGGLRGDAPSTKRAPGIKTIVRGRPPVLHD